MDIPEGFDFRQWLERWDRMQARYLVRRWERFATIARLVAGTQGEVSRILDLGCGTGSLTIELLESIPAATVLGVDFDPTLLPLATYRLRAHLSRVRLVRADLRQRSWVKLVPEPVDAVVSATALHWLGAEQLTALYDDIRQVLRPGGIFLNADHVGSEDRRIQQVWEGHRETMRHQEGFADADDWDGFFEAYGRALGIDIGEIRQPAIGEYHGNEEGMPLAWHFAQLKSHGFAYVDCFWRCDCDAIYGGIRQ